MSHVSHQRRNVKINVSQILQGHTRAFASECLETDLQRVQRVELLPGGQPWVNKPVPAKSEIVHEWNPLGLYFYQQRPCGLNVSTLGSCQMRHFISMIQHGWFHEIRIWVTWVIWVWPAWVNTHKMTSGDQEFPEFEPHFLQLVRMGGMNLLPGLPSIGPWMVPWHTAQAPS